MVMELYTLDSLLRRDTVIDQYISLVWTERFKSFGDFELDIYADYSNRSLFKTGTLLAMNKSYRVMRIETVEDDVTEEGAKILKITGRSLEVLLMDRVAKQSLTDLTTSPTWDITDVPAAIMRKLFHDICVTGILSPYDIIPGVSEDTFMPASTIPEPIDPIKVSIEPVSVYDATVQIADTWILGFRLLRQSDTGQLYYDVYSGTDRTTAQTAVPPVIFSPGLDNLQNTKELITIEPTKNVAYVFSPAGFQMVFPNGVDETISGMDRRVLVVNASDVTTDAYPTTDDVTAALTQRGNEELAKNVTVQSLDGEISQHSQFVYGKDFNLGDVVEMRSDDGETNNMRVTEQIFTSDDTGEKSYPTLTVNTFITTGSWLSWLNNKTWEDMAAEVVTPYWADQP